MLILFCAIISLSSGSLIKRPLRMFQQQMLMDALLRVRSNSGVGTVIGSTGEGSPTVAESVSLVEGLPG